MEWTLKDYAIEYQKGNVNILGDLISTRKVSEQNNGKKSDLVDRLQFTDTYLNLAYLNVCKSVNHINWKDIDHYAMQAIYRIKNDKVVSIFDKVDTERTPEEVAAFIKTKFIGFIKNKVNEQEQKYYKPTKPNEYSNPNQAGEDDEEVERKISLYDSVAYKEFTAIESNNEYKEFLEFFGGIEEILSKSQMQVYNLLKDQSKLKKDIAKEHGSSPANITKQYKSIAKTIKSKWIYYKSVKSFTESGLYEKIKRFIDEYDKVYRFVSNDEFDYFGYIINFLKGNYKKGEQEVVFNHDTFKHFNKHQITLHNTVFDLLADEVTPKTYKNLYDILEEDMDIQEFDTYLLGKREKNIIRNQVIKVFKRYINECEKALEKVSEYIAEHKNIKSNNILK